MRKKALFIKTLKTPFHHFALSLITFSVFLMFSHANASETRHHGAHEHGVGKLNIALDEKDLIIELLSPAANIVGFEHAPENEQQKHEVHEAIELLNSWEKIFVVTPEAQCNVHEIHVDNDMLTEDHDDGHNEHEHVHEGHSTKTVHSEFKVEYHLKCESPNNLKDLNIMLFSLFPSFEEIEVQLLSLQGQTSVELTPQNSQISL